MTNWFKDWWGSIREWLGAANTKIDEVQGEVVEDIEDAKVWAKDTYADVEAKVDETVAKVNEKVDGVQEELKEVSSMIDKATSEES